MAVGTHFVPVPISAEDGALGLHIAWLDATSAATITLELSSFASLEAPYDQPGSPWHWIDSGEVIAGPTGAGGGGSLLNVENVRQKQARLRVVVTAATVLEVYDGAS
jgi:hypothetical protein